MSFMFQKMVVAGVGLIGGSLALAAREAGLVKEIIGYGRGEENLRLAEKRGIVGRYFLDPNEMPQGVDLVILATPVRAIVSLAGSFLPSLRPGCLVSDVGSAKEKIVEEMEELLPSGIFFVGAHPIAGSEQWGAEAAIPDLFSGRRCILTATPNTDRGALSKMVRFWTSIGASVEVMDPQLHDRVLGIVSHLPHVLAYALVNMLVQAKVDSVDLKAYCGGGFKDLTRIASSRPEIWRDICLVNRRAISESLGHYIDHLERVKQWIWDGEGSLLEEEFARANEIRRQIP